MKNEKKSRCFELIRFCLVGGVAAGTHYVIYYLLQQVIALNLAYTAGYCLSLIANFFLTSYFTFRSHPSFKKAAGFGLSHLVNYVLHIALFNLFLALQVDSLIAPILVLLIAVPITFLLLRFVYKPKSTHETL
ncbi:MAG: GtrA family protein [Phocaeicola sp.]